MKSSLDDCSKGPYGTPFGAWDVSGVTDMSGMFAVTSFNADVSKWDVSRVTDMNGMFNHATSFDGDLSQWDVSRVTDMDDMFASATSFNGDLSLWDVSRVQSMIRMFKGASSFKQRLCGAAWVNSKASKDDMFTDSLGSISLTVCGACCIGIDISFTFSPQHNRAL